MSIVDIHGFACPVDQMTCAIVNLYVSRDTQYPSRIRAYSVKCDTLLLVVLD